MSDIRIAIIGDFNPEFVAHVTNGPAIEHAAAKLGVPVDVAWVASDEIDAANPASALESFDGLWFTSGGPYRHRPGILAALRFARESRKPTIGTCAGFQYGLLEYARNVLGRPELEHGEDVPDAESKLITGVACPAPARAPGGGLLSGAPIRIHLREGSRASEIAGTDQIEEEYNCNFELNPEFDEIFEETGLEFTGFGDRGESRIFEIPEHPFYVATLFQPQRKSRPGAPSPFALGFLEAVAAARVTRA
ncbi:MAG TPA: hypothetical protein VJW75_03825 [Candidatus Eisenbacteria bacterium]|nr:hypothetical protein [Candidatus Eisenbacteria bacterium]